MLAPIISYLGLSLFLRSCTSLYTSLGLIGGIGKLICHGSSVLCLISRSVPVLRLGVNVSARKLAKVSALLASDLHHLLLLPIIGIFLIVAGLNGFNPSSDELLMQFLLSIIFPILRLMKTMKCVT